MLAAIAFRRFQNNREHDGTMICGDNRRTLDVLRHFRVAFCDLDRRARRRFDVE
jgi:hypothetical protein